MKKIIPVMLAALLMTACSPEIPHEPPQSTEPEKTTTIEEICGISGDIYSEEVMTVDLIYNGNKTFIDLYGETPSFTPHHWGICETVTEYYKDVNVGDIARFNANFLLHTYTEGASGGYTSITIGEVNSFEIVTDFYYTDNDIEKIEVGKNIVSVDTDFWKLANSLGYWRYAYNTDTNSYISVIDSVGKQLIIENGNIAYEFDEKLLIDIGDFKYLIFANKDTTVREIESEIKSGEFTKIFCLTKMKSKDSQSRESNVEEITRDFIYRGDNKFFSDNTGQELAIQIDFWDCSEYQIGDIFRISGEFAYAMSSGRYNMEAIYDVENVTKEYYKKGDKEAFVYSSKENISMETYDFFMKYWTSRWLYFYDTAKDKYISIVKVDATHEHPEYYAVFENGEFVSKHDYFGVKDKGDKRIVFLGTVSFDVEYYLGGGYTDVIFAWLN